MWKVVSNTRRGDNIRDININYTSYIFIERLLQKRILFFFFFFIYAFSSSRNKRKKFHTNCKFIRFLITFFRSIRIERWGIEEICIIFQVQNWIELMLIRCRSGEGGNTYVYIRCERVTIDRTRKQRMNEGDKSIGSRETTVIHL